jgi:hypothetical protein
MSAGPHLGRLQECVRGWVAARRGAAALAALLALVLASRLAALPASIWEQDEAYLAMAVQHFDPANGVPQPPWSPLWLALGRIGTLLGLEATRSLQLLSLAAGTAMLLPLVSLWGGLLGRGRGTLAALLFLATPVAWLNAGRGLTETAATAALAAMCACWCRERRSDPALVWGSLAGAAAFLVRPQLLPAVALPALVVLATSRGARERLRVAVPGLALALAGAAGTVAAAGGVAPLATSMARHRALHFGQLGDVSYAFAASGLARGLLHPAAAAAWIALALAGAVVLLRAAPAMRRRAAVSLAALLGAVLAVYGVASPQHARYFIPILALSAGLVVAGAVALLGRAAPTAVAVAIVALACQVVPGFALYRSRPSPPVAALRLAAERQRATGAAVIVDRRLGAFVDHERAFRSPEFRVVWDYEAQLGLGGLAGAAEVVAVCDANHPLERAAGATVERISWPESPVRRLSPARYVDVTVADLSRQPGSGS